MKVQLYIDPENKLSKVPYQVPNNIHYVRYQDYLDAQTRLIKAGDAMASCIQFNEEMEQDYNGPTIVRQCVKDWNAAKEGKQP
jgi:hypothetical protein